MNLIFQSQAHSGLQLVRVVRITLGRSILRGRQSTPLIQKIPAQPASEENLAGHNAGLKAFEKFGFE
jgi:hypothetical protein